MGRKTAKGGVLGIGASFVRTFIQLLITVALSRVLDVDDYGLVAMAGTVIVFFSMFSDLGMGGAIVQRREVDHQLLSNLFWISCSVGAGLFLLCCLLSPLVGMFYHDDRLVGIMIVSALAMPLASLSSSHQSIMARQARWVEINLITVVSQTISGIAAIIGAIYFSLGYWALALQGIAGPALAVIAFWTLCRWRPGLPREWKEAREAVHFGGYFMAFNFVNYAHRQMDKVIVGRMLGQVDIGLYSRAYNLFTLPASTVAWPLAGVVTPLMARQQDDPQRFAMIYYSALAAAYVLIAPLAGGLFFFAHELVLLLYGDKWTEVASVLSILGLVILGQPAYSSGGWIEMSLGRSKRHFHASIFASALYLAAFLVGVRYGITGVAKAYLVANIIVVGPWLWFTVQGTTVTLWGIVRAIRGALIAAVLAIVAIWLLAPRIHIDIWIIDFFVKAAIYGVAYLLVLLACWKLDRGWSEIITSAASKLKIGSKGQ